MPTGSEDDGVHLAAGLCPNLGRGARVVRAPVGRVVKLVGEEAVGVLGRPLAREVAELLGVGVGQRPHGLHGRAQGAEDRVLFLSLQCTVNCVEERLWSA